MNWNQIEGYLTQVLGRVREFWGIITNRRVHVISGRRAQMVGILQRKYGNGTQS